jgi:misacylated tRNA(Ala) deacylase
VNISPKLKRALATMATTTTQPLTAMHFGGLACQRDSYLTELSAKIVTCNETKDPEKFDLFLTDSIIFPEGGGQPDDVGTIAGQEVLGMRRENGTAIYTVGKRIETGTEVQTSIDWPKRFDHMQQHSGQHLITAIALQLFDIPTTSWCLGEQRCFLNLATKKLSEEQLQQLEQKVNAEIRAGKTMLPRWLEMDSPELKTIRCRGLPEGTRGPVRVVEIEGVDANLCCGTHVKNLSHLQMIKLTHMVSVIHERDKCAAHSPDPFTD